MLGSSVGAPDRGRDRDPDGCRQLLLGGGRKGVATLRSRVGFGEFALGEAIEPRPAGEDLSSNLRGDARIGQNPTRHLGEARVEMRKIRLHADVFSTTQELNH
jgi:hypothetical protein